MEERAREPRIGGAKASLDVAAPFAGLCRGLDSSRRRRNCELFIVSFLGDVREERSERSVLSRILVIYEDEIDREVRASTKPK